MQQLTFQEGFYHRRLCKTISQKYFHGIIADNFAANQDICEDYGQVAVYKGTIEHAPHRFVLDDHHTFVTGKPMLVCGNTASMIEETRFASHFTVSGDKSVHYGPFDCGKPAVADAEVSAENCC